VGTTVVTGALGARVVVVIPGLGTVVGVAATARVVVVMGTVEPLWLDVVRDALVRFDEELLALFDLPREAAPPPAGVLDPRDVPPWEDGLVVGELALPEGAVVWVMARAFAAFAACATNIPAAMPELRKTAWVKSRTRANFFAMR
jgi:hypothetical protein